LDTPSYLSLFSINSIRYVKDNRYRQYFQTFMTVLCVSITQIKHINTNHKRPVRNQESQNKQAPTICTAKYQALVWLKADGSLARVWTHDLSCLILRSIRAANCVSYRLWN